MSSNSPTPLLPLLLTCALLCAACAQAPPKTKIVKESRHANGLTVGVPEGFEAKPTEDGFVVEPSGNTNRQVRFPIGVYISFIKGLGPQDDDVGTLRSKSVGGRNVVYRVTKSEGGSGGALYTLSVHERAPGGHVEYTQAMQSEDGEPDFDLCWTLVGSTKYQPTNK